MTYAKRSSGRKLLAPALAVVVTGFLAFSLPPYFTGGTRVPATFGLHYPLLVAHVMLASVAMVCAVAQIWPGLRHRHPRLHRRAGRAYVCTAIPAAACAMVIGAATPFGPILAVGNVVLSALWLWFTINGYLAVRRGRIAEHRRHMIRSATLALSIITNRIWTPVLFIGLHPLQDSAFGGSEEHFTWVVAGLGAWLGWSIPLLAVQWWLTRKPDVAPSSISRSPGALRV
ncbi:DUF2306 domain-containing protein [Mycobacterium sp. URHB0044]|uniref:DUF2306 domain-containing protein n=1 Tax=Mycobacterium sp. URHB0044 TaxID=1380386 RepID=UPI000568D5F8|nr:DUF2306 domain-containing protein [Mycobacterium sp. URHB0044]